MSSVYAVFQCNSDTEFIHNSHFVMDTHPYRFLKKKKKKGMIRGTGALDAKVEELNRKD